MKCVGMPIRFRWVKIYSEIRLLSTPLAVDDLVLLGVEGRGIIFEELDQSARLRTFVKDLGLALVDTAATVHE